MTSIPQEIIDLIAPHLNQHDLADCSRVCHDWSSLFSPWLWRSINIANQSTHDRFNTPESRAALIRNKHLVREVTATDQDLLLLLAAHDHSEPSLPKLTGLRSLTLCFYADAPWALTMGTTPQEDENEGEDEVTVTATEALAAMTVRLARVDNFRALLELLSNNTNLRNLRLNKGCLRGADRTELLPHIMEACATTSLTTLEVCLNDVPKYPPKPKPRFTTNTTHLEDYQSFRLATRHYQDQRPFLTLKELIFLGRRSNQNDFSRLAVLAHCIHLVRLEFRRIESRVGNLLAFGRRDRLASSNGLPLFDRPGPLWRHCSQRFVFGGVASVKSAWLEDSGTRRPSLFPK